MEERSQDNSQIVVCRCCWARDFAPVCTGCSLRIEDGKSVRVAGQLLHTGCYENRRKCEKIDGSKLSSIKSKKGEMKKKKTRPSQLTGSSSNHSLVGAKSALKRAVSDYANL